MFKQWLQNFSKPQSNVGGFIALLSMSFEHKKFHRFVADTINLPQNGRVLDIGCGGGVFIKEMQKRAKGSVFYGIDASVQSVNYAKRVNQKSIANGLVKISQGDASSIPFEDNSFDLVTACATVYFWQNVVSSFKKVLGILKPGGCFVVAGGTHKEEHSASFAKIIQGMTYYTESEIRDFLQQAGFVEVDIKLDETAKVSCVIGKKPGETKQIPCGLGGVPETMLIPLWAKAYENRKPERILHDDFAESILNAIDYDFGKLAHSRLSQLGCCVRTLIIDKALTRFLEKNPQAVVVNLGAGLCTRVKRLEKTNFSQWIDLDVKEAIDIRRKFIAENERISFIAKSVMDFSWMDEIPADKPVIFIAEGLFMYFTGETLKPLFQAIAQRFKNGEMLYESIAPMGVKRTKFHDSVGEMQDKPEFLWSPSDSNDIEKWDDKIKFVEEWNYFDTEKKRWGLFGSIARCPLFRKSFACRISHLQFN